jgi:hypothetical protein
MRYQTKKEKLEKPLIHSLAKKNLREPADN